MFATTPPRWTAVAALCLVLAAPAAASQGLPAADMRDRIKRVGANLFSATPNAPGAVEELRSILAAEPNSAEAHMLLGLAYRIRGQTTLLGEAVAELRQALALNPELTLARLSLARIYLDMARPARARDELAIADEKAPGQPQVIALRAEAERQLGNPQRAIELARQVLSTQESFAQARYYLGLALLDAGQRADAIRELETVARSGVNGAEVYLGLGSAYLAAGRNTDAVAALRESVRLEPSKPDTHIRLAHAYRALGRLPEAIKELSAAAPSAESIEGLYTNVQADYHMEEGLVRLAQGRLDAAAAAFEKVLALDANNDAARQKLAEVQKRQQRPPRKTTGDKE